MQNNTVDDIVRQLTRFKNGVAADSMAEKGLAYQLNYGVSVTDISKVAKPYAYNNVLAAQLFERPEREAKIAAIYITDPSQLTENQTKNLARFFINSEMVEQLVLRLIYKQPYAIACAVEWCNKTDNQYWQKAGWMTVGRAATLPEATEQQLQPFIALIDSADLSSVHVRAALVYALPKIAEKSAALKETVQHWMLRNSTSNNNDLQYVVGEVKAFLTL